MAHVRLEVFYARPERAHGRPQRTQPRVESMHSADDESIPHLGGPLFDNGPLKCGMGPLEQMDGQT